MEKKLLRAILPWRRLAPGTHAATTATGEVYVVRQRSDGWEVSLRQEGKGEVQVGDDLAKLLWVGKCRAEHHYTQLASGHTEVAAPKKSEPSRATTKSGESRTAAKAAGEPRGTKEKGSHRKRRGVERKPPASAGPRVPPKVASAVKSPKKAAGVSVPMETPLSWSNTKDSGRSACVAEYPGGTLKIVKTADFHTLVRQPDGEDAQPVACGSLCEMKDRAEGLVQEPAPAPKPDKRSPPPRTGKERARDKVVDVTATPVDARKDAAIVAGLRDLLGNLKPPAARSG